MNIPTLPSGSIYRFKSIVGLMLILISLCLNFFIIIDYSQKSIHLNSEIETINKDIDNSLNEMEIIKLKVIPICKLNYCKCIDENGNLIKPIFEKGPPLINKKQKELIQLYSQYTEISKAIESKNAKVLSRTKLLENYASNMNRFFIILIITLIIGIIILFTGIKEWENKIQKYHDAIMESQARKLDSNIQQILPRRRRKLG